MTESNTKTYTLKEIAEHTSEESLWLLIEDGVYDVTKFLSEHPGGEEPMIAEAGKDATDAFIEVGHSTIAREMMKEYKIGELCPEDRLKPQKKQCSSCFYIRLAVPIGMVLVAAFAYKMYTHFIK